MRPLLVLFLFLTLAAPVKAGECHGQNLIAALPPDQLAALKAEADVPFAHGNLWTATRDGQEITLAGTYHLNDPRFDATLTRLAPALAQATALLVEAGPVEEAALKDAVTRDPGLMFLTTGPTLPEQLSPHDWDSLSKALRARGMAPFMAAKMQPWLVATMLDMPACLFPLQTGADQGLDKRLIALATARGLPVHPLEPYDTALKIFAQFSPADQLALLTQTLAMDASSDDMARTLSDSYFAGESQLFWAYSAKAMLDQPGMTPELAARETDLISRAMISSRNAAWIPVLEAAARQGPVLAAFGALHLPGETGVLNLLARDGWTVKALTP